MSSKKILLYFGINSLLLVILTLIYVLLPKIVIELNGSENITLELNKEYVEMGANAYLDTALKKDKVNVKIEGHVDNQKIGEYTIKYIVKNHGLISEKKRVVKVIDNIKPVITLNDEIKLCKNNQLVNINASVNDNYDTDLINKLHYKIKDDKIYLSVSDNSGNKAELVENVKYIDDEKPVLNLNNEENIYLSLGESYVEYGATAFDSCDGDLTSNIKIDGNVDVNKVGTYEVIYTVKDSNDNTIEKVRKIIVEEVKGFSQEKVDNGIIYLTFDDGPGQYTSDFLKILSNYNIKATFFVTNQFPKYNYIIKQEFELGHSIGIHTYSHKWAIYTSLDTYLDDFYKMDNIIFEQTGNHSKIFRFPGGSSNTISRNYSKGIMSSIAKYMTDLEYVYFDWNIDSGDTSRNKNSRTDIIKTVKENLKGNGEYIILMHDLKKNSLEALPEIIEYALNRGYVFKSLTTSSSPIHFKIAN